MISKVKSIWNIKEFKNDYWITFYHACTLEDGQFISIGKKQSGAVKVWDEIEYEMELDKAKEIKKPFLKWWFQKPKQNLWSFALSYSKDIAIAKDMGAEETIKIADLFYNWLKTHE